MHKIGICTSGGYDLTAMAHKPQDYYQKLAFYTEGGDPIQRGVHVLAATENIEQFKKDFHLKTILHLSLGPCGIHQFTIEDDKFTFRMADTYAIP